MGNVLTQTICGFSRKKDVRVAMAGPGHAGKTTLLYQLKLGENVNPHPTISGFNSETIDHDRHTFTICDFGGWPSRYRILWPYYFANCQALLFVVDCADAELLDDARLELADMLATDCFRDAVLLVFANKQDRANAISAADLMDMLRLHAYTDRTWAVQPSCAATGEGLKEGLLWLAEQLEHNC